MKTSLLFYIQTKAKTNHTETIVIMFMTKLQVMILTAICERALTQFAMVTTVNFTQSESLRLKKNV